MRAARVLSGGAWPLRQRAAQPAARERAPRDDAHAEAPAERQHLGLDAAHEHRVRRLLADEPRVAARLGDPLRGHDLARRIRRRADVADLARTHEIGERAERLVVIGVVVEAVDLVEVDPVGAEPAQAGLALLDDPAARVAALVRAFAHRPVHLRREHDLVAASFERLGDDLLRLAARVDVRGVDEVDPGVERRWMIRIDSSWSVFPHAPNIIAPRQSGLTLHSGATERAVLHRSRP